MTRINEEELLQTRHVVLFVGPEGRELWRAGRTLGDEIIVPEGRRPFPEEERVYTREKTIILNEERDAAEALSAAIEQVEE